MAQYLTFFIGDEEYAADILSVREIIEYSPLTRVPMTPPWVRGVMNLRGTVVPVVDLAVKFGLEERQPTKRTCFVVAEVLLDETRRSGIVRSIVILSYAVARAFETWKERQAEQQHQVQRAAGLHIHLRVSSSEAAESAMADS